MMALVPGPPALLEIHLQHQIALAQQLAPLDASLSVDVSFSVAQRSYLATGKTKSYDHIICTRCHALRFSSQLTCRACGSVPRRKRWETRDNRSTAHKVVPPPTGTSSSPGAQVSTASPCPSLPQLNARPTLSSLSSLPGAPLNTAKSPQDVPSGTVHAGSAAPLQSSEHGLETAIDALESKASKKRKRLLAAAQNSTPSDTASAVPAIALPQAQKSSLLTLLESSGLSTFGLAAIAPGKMTARVGSTPKDISTSPAASVAVSKRFSFTTIGT